MTTIAGIAGSIGAVAFLALFLLLLVAARGKLIGRLLNVDSQAFGQVFELLAQLPLPSANIHCLMPLGLGPPTVRIFKFVLFLRQAPAGSRADWLW